MEWKEMETRWREKNIYFKILTKDLTEREKALTVRKIRTVVYFTKDIHFVRRRYSSRAGNEKMLNMKEEKEYGEKIKTVYIQ